MKVCSHIAALAVMLLAAWPVTGSADDPNQNTPSSSVRVNPLMRERALRPGHSITGGTHFDSGGGSTSSRSSIRFYHEGDDWSVHGSLRWRDSYGVWHGIVPGSSYDRALLSYGFVPSHISDYYAWQRWQEDSSSKMTFPVRPPDFNVYYLNVQPPTAKAEQESEVLTPKKPVEKAQPEPPRPDSALAALLGGSGQVSEAFAAGEGFLRRAQFDKAVESFQKAQVAEPENPVPMLGLGLTYLAWGDFRQAARWIREAMGRHQGPDKITLDAWQMFGGPAVYDMRFMQIRVALADDPNNADMHLLAGFLYMCLADWTRAAEHFGQAEKLNPTDEASARLRAIAARNASATAAPKVAGQ